MNKPLTLLGVAVAASLLVAGGRANATNWGPATPASEMKTGMTVPAALPPGFLIDENFDELSPRGLQNTPVGTQFTAHQVGIGSLANSGLGFSPRCAPPQTGLCAWLRQAAGGANNGVLTSREVTLQANTTYLLSFQAVRNDNIPAAPASSVTVTLGPPGGAALYDPPAFSLTPGGTNGIVTGAIIRAPNTERVELVFTAGGADNNFGAAIDNVVLREAPAAAPEPATIGLMVLGLLGGAGFARRKRKS